MKILLFILLLLANNLYSQVTIDAIDAESSCSNTTTITTGISYAVASTEVAILFVMATNDGGGLADPSSISGGGVATWTKITSIQFATVGTPTRQISVYRGVGGGASSAVTVTWAAAQKQKYVMWYRVGGVPLTNNGADAIVQSASDNGDAESNPSITMAAITRPTNAVIAAYAGNHGTVTGTPEAGFTEDEDNVSSTCFSMNRWFYSMHDAATTDNTPTVTTSAAIDWGGTAIEIKSTQRRIIHSN